jgi:hypothetical protein
VGAASDDGEDDGSEGKEEKASDLAAAFKAAAFEVLAGFAGH